MFTLRKSSERGRTQLGWLDSYHSFSFGDYHDPKHHNFGALRVINDDRVEVGGGFGMHPHRDMEILTYVLSGSVQHRDSLGNGSVIRAGDVQRITAGRGVMHSEFNPSTTEAAHFLQIWVMPNAKGLAPSYVERSFGDRLKTGTSTVLASLTGRDDSVAWNQDVDLAVIPMSPGTRAVHQFAEGRRGWLQVATGSVRVGETRLVAGDALMIEGEREVALDGVVEGQVLMFDLGN